MLRRLFVAPLFLLATLPLAAGDCGPDEENAPGDDPARLGCETVLCAAGTFCEEIDGEPVCLPSEEGPSCDDVVCDSGFTCTLVEVQCVTAPCFPQPTCVPDEEPAGEPAYTACLADDDCAPFESCDLEHFCERAPGCGPESFCPALCYGRCVDDEGGAAAPQ